MQYLQSLDKKPSISYLNKNFKKLQSFYGILAHKVEKLHNRVTVTVKRWNYGVTVERCKIGTENGGTVEMCTVERWNSGTVSARSQMMETQIINLCSELSQKYYNMCFFSDT